MKIAIAAAGNNLDGPLSPQFGRANGFFIGEEESAMSYVENPHKGGMRGVGISVAQFMAEKQVKAVIANLVGPRAVDALNSLGITAYLAEKGSVKENIRLFKEGKLRKIS